MTDGQSRRTFFNTTRGRMLRMLCFRPLTVAELAKALNLTGNAVRAQLAVLEREGLARQRGLRAGVRKPHFDYEITPQGRRQFPTAYELVFAQLVDVLSELAPRRLRSRLFREVALRLARSHLERLRDADPSGRLTELKNVVAACGPGFEMKREDHSLVIRACTCPLASVVSRHPDLCEVVAGVLSDALRTTVNERCDRGDSPRCRFELKAPSMPEKAR